MSGRRFRRLGDVTPCRGAECGRQRSRLIVSSAAPTSRAFGTSGSFGNELCVRCLFSLSCSLSLSLSHSRSLSGSCCFKLSLLGEMQKSEPPLCQGRSACSRRRPTLCFFVALYFFFQQQQQSRTTICLKLTSILKSPSFPFLLATQHPFLLE